MITLAPREGCIVVAHPDDELIFLWMAFPFTKRIVAVVSDDSTTTEFSCYKERKQALAEVGKLLNVETICLNYDSWFSKKPETYEPIKKEIKNLTKDCSFVFTHNEFGDYGHKDHLAVNQIVMQLDLPTIVSNFRSKPVTGKLLGSFTNDLSLYNTCKAIYVKHQAWSWNQAPSVRGSLIYKENV